MMGGILIRQILLYIIATLLLIMIIANFKLKESPSPFIENLKKLELSLWLVDWNLEASIEEAVNTGDGVDNYQLFSTYFDEGNNLYQTEDGKQLIEQAFSNNSFADHNIYLTIINDQFLSENQVNQKDSELLRKILSSNTTIEEHIQQIIHTAKQFPFDGVELDYEKIPENLILSYTTFLEELNNELKMNNLSLRVVLEPSFPIESVSLPQDIQYVVMAYNLYGYHSGPGPKANYEFLEKLTNKLSKTNHDINIALATGGFIWNDQYTDSLTEQEVEKIVQDYQVHPTRDSNSDAMHFTFIDNENIKNEVWYADASTLQSWINYLNNKNFHKISIWRAGGLSTNTLNLFKLHSM
ncbi:MAG TPA: glycosyl hydrolase family 18 protein [Ureibacillus sp.]|nr:glycosyl hydrolase family 18 protein [Ureibacillus sp.]